MQRMKQIWLSKSIIFIKGLYNFSESINEKLVNCAYNALIDLKNAVNRK